ncbi:MAG: DUF4197 domain-containing protein [Gammaproteobacteria bacterium]|nr:DUF4197 domain-containing protein [Gammaproteobacteria bacterium]MBU1416064.1 DUF4197 domain-containing protein [Gammaproteobacteria bacterium]
MRKLLTLFAALILSSAAHALSLDQLTNKDAVGGLKQALTQGAGKAVDMLGKTDGFLGNEKVKIPLPENLQRAEHTMRTIGLGKYADELITSMNRAAEAAMPEAKKTLVASIKQMSVSDAKGILAGEDNAATEYFRRTTAEPLGEKFKPIVRKAMAKVKLAQRYDQFVGKADMFGLVREEDASLEDYVTRKALDGVFLMIAEEEKAIRADPVAAAGRLAKKVFGAIGK